MDNLFGPSSSTILPGQVPAEVELHRQQHQQQQQQQEPAFTLLTTPPIPWPRPALAGENILQLGGRYWPSPKPPSTVVTAAAVVLELADELDRAQHASAAAKDDYLQALYLPESAFPLADFVHTLARHSDLLPLSLIRPVAAVTHKHRRDLPSMLTSLTSARPPDFVREREPGSPFDELEWRALRAGFGIRLGSNGLGVAAKPTDGESEEDRNERCRFEEERWLAAGKTWIEGLERREVRMQVLLHFLLPPPPTALAAAPLPKKRGRKAARAATPSDSELEEVNLAQSLMAYADRLSIWQALATLGVDSLSLGDDVRKGQVQAGPSSAGAAASKPKSDWVAEFYLDIIEPNFGLSHPGFCHILTSTLQITAANPRPMKATPLRHEAGTQQSQPMPPTSVVWPPPGGASGTQDAPSASSRRKGKAKQLPDEANRYVLAAANATGPASSRLAGSASRSLSTGDKGGSRSAFSRSASTSATTTNLRPGLLAPGRKSSTPSSTAATILERAASLGPPAALKPRRANSLGPSAAAAASNATGSSSSRSISFSRAGSHGPGTESQTEKLMRRSVSFTKGAGVGRKAAGGSAASGDSGGSAKGEQTKLDGLWGARVSRVGASAAADEKGKNGRRESLQRPKSFGSSVSIARLAHSGGVSTSQTLVPETPVKPSGRALVPDTPTSSKRPPLAAFVAETPPAATLGKAHIQRFGSGSGGSASWALGRVMEGTEEGMDEGDGLGEFFESDDE